MVDCFRKIIKNEGFSRLYRGISAPILMEAPKRWDLVLSDIWKVLTTGVELLSSLRTMHGESTIAVYSA